MKNTKRINNKLILATLIAFSVSAVLNQPAWGSKKCSEYTHKAKCNAAQSPFHTKEDGTLHQNKCIWGTKFKQQDGGHRYCRDKGTDDKNKGCCGQEKNISPSGRT